MNTPPVDQPKKATPSSSDVTLDAASSATPETDLGFLQSRHRATCPHPARPAAAAMHSGLRPRWYGPRLRLREQRADHLLGLGSRQGNEFAHPSGPAKSYRKRLEASATAWAVARLPDGTIRVLRLAKVGEVYRVP